MLFKEEFLNSKFKFEKIIRNNETYILADNLSDLNNLSDIMSQFGSMIPWNVVVSNFNFEWEWVKMETNHLKDIIYYNKLKVVETPHTNIRFVSLNKIKTH